ncbi:MAG TPA: glycosyltransferase [Thermoanaerobaculaceae bacterium]|nr:glycosyltransferase [Thermoanaerobaculaceae bacterium]HPS78544.1 glycosyltransferase [Thermoanaerobaculaceae bacterium]
MRVALVHDWLTGMRGGEAVLAEIASFFPDAPIYTLFHRRGTISGELLRHPIHTSFLQKLTFGGRWYRGLLSLMHYGVAGFSLEGYDLVISSSHCVAKGVIPPPGAVHLCYCHTPMRYLWDQREEYLRRMNPVLRPLVRAKLEDLRAWDVVSAARVDHFIANSKLVARRIERYWRRQAEVVPPPIDIASFTPGGDRDDYLLMVAALVPYKRVDVGIEVATRMGKPLHVIGDGPLDGRLRRQAGPHVQFLHRLSTEALRDQFRRAALLLVPNVEDFGMVTVEALACGTPVVGLAGSGTSDAVQTGVHGELAPDGSPEALESACKKVLARVWDRPALRHRAESFSRQRFRQRFGFLLERHVPGYRQA